tara:strand:+ start:498 stop:1934 length:1437 start_codon:yes stop_codon:yes gene_type:complete
MPIVDNPDIPLDNKQLRMYDSTGKFSRMSVDETIARGQNKWKGWKCSAGVRGLYIDYDGNIWNGNCASANQYSKVHTQKVTEFTEKAFPEDVTEIWRQYRESVIGADFSDLRIKWINENTEGGWATAGGPNWREKEQHQKLTAEISRLEEEFFVKKIGDSSNFWYNQWKKDPDNWKWTSTLDDMSSTWGLLGNIREGVNIPEEYATCPFNSCGCGADVILSKAKTDEHLKMLDVTANGHAGTVRVQNYTTDPIQEGIAMEMNFSIPYQILWDLGRRCNYSCDYCWPAVHSSTEKFHDFEKVINTINMISDHWSKGQSIRWNFGGGEPTMHPKFIEILKYLKSKGHWILVTTNGARSNKFWREASKYINSVNMSAHFASMDLYRGNEDRFVENCKIIMDQHDQKDDDHWLEIKLMVPSGFLDRAQLLRDRLLEIPQWHTPGANGRPKGEISLVPIRDITNSSELTEYSDNEIEFFRNQS